MRSPFNAPPRGHRHRPGPLCAAGVLLVLLSMPAAAQVTMTLQLRNPMPAQLSAWEQDPTLLQAVIVNAGGTTYSNVGFSFVISDVGAGSEAARSEDADPSLPRFTIPAASTITLNGPDLVNLNAITVDPRLRDLAVTTNALPEGDFEICARLIDISGNSLLAGPDVCQGFLVIIPDPPVLLTPTDEAAGPEFIRPTFSWTPVILPGVSIEYRLVLCPVYEGQSTRDAVERNIPLLDERLGLSSYAYSVRDPDLTDVIDARAFAWQVQALDEFGAPATRGEGKSAISSFAIVEPRITVSVSPFRIEPTAADPSHHMTFTVRVPEGTPGVSLNRYVTTLTDDDQARNWYENSGDIVIDPPLYVPSGGEGTWTHVDAYDAALRSILLNGRERADYRKTFRFSGINDNRIPIGPLDAPPYAIHLAAAEFSVTFSPAILTYTTAVTSQSGRFDFQGSALGDIHVRQHEATWFLEDGTSLETGAGEVDLTIPRNGTGAWEPTIAVAAGIICGELDRLGQDETEIRVMYQFNGELRLDQPQPVSATASFLIRFARTGGGPLRVTASPSVLEFTPMELRRDITFRYEASCFPARLVSNHARMTRADGRSVLIDATPMDLAIPAGGTVEQTLGQPLTAEFLCGTLDALDTDGTDVDVTYYFVFDIDRLNGQFVRDTTETRFVLRLSRVAGQAPLTVTAEPGALHYHPGQTEQTVRFSLSAGSRPVRLESYDAVWITPDGDRLSIEPTIWDTLVSSCLPLAFDLHGSMSAETQQRNLDRYHMPLMDVEVVYTFRGTVEGAGGRREQVTAEARYTMRISGGGSLLTISGEPASPIRFYPGAPAHPLTYAALLSNAAAGPVEFTYLEAAYVDAEDGSTVAVLYPDAAEGHEAVSVAPGGTWDYPWRESFDEQRLQLYLEGRTRRTLWLTLSIDTEIAGVSVRGTSNRIEITLFASEEDSRQGDLIAFAIPHELDVSPEDTTHAITYSLDLMPSHPDSITLFSAGVTYRNEDGTVYRGPIETQLPDPVRMAPGDRREVSGTLTVGRADREDILSGGRDQRTLTATVEFGGLTAGGREIRSAANPITVRVYRTAEAAGGERYTIVEGAAYVRTNGRTVVTTEGDRTILSGSASLVIFVSPFDSTQVVDVDLAALTFSGRQRSVTSGSLAAETASDVPLLSVLGEIYKITRISYDHTRQVGARLRADSGYVMFLRSRMDISDVTISRDGLSLRNASIEYSMFGLTFRFTEMQSGKEGDRRLLSFTVHPRLKGRPRDDEFARSTLKYYHGGDFSGRFTPTPKLRLFSDYLSFTNFEFQKQDSAWFLKATTEINYPAPFKNLGPTEASLKYDQAGNLTGELAPIIEREGAKPSVGDGDRSWTSIGNFAVADLTYLGLQLALINGEIDSAESHIGLAASFYFDDGTRDWHRVEVGNSEDPAITIDFDGDVHWRAITIARDKKFKLGPMVLGIESLVINPQPTDQIPHFFEIAGGIGVDHASVEGMVNFEAFRIDQEGDVDMASTVVRGGEFRIVDVVALGIGDFDFSNRPTRLTYKSKDGGRAVDRGVDVTSYFKLTGASLSIGSRGRGGSGGFSQLLVYTNNDGQTSFILDSARVEIAEVKIWMDCRHIQDSSGSALTVAGAVDTPGGIDGAVVGKIGTIDDDATYGLFLAIGGLNIPIGPITLTELGGGFFYNPTEADLELVRNSVGINRALLDSLTTSRRPNGGGDAGGFAAMIYAAAKVADEDILKGKALITVTENYLSLDINAELLKKAGKGWAFMMFSWDPAYAEGLLKVKFDYEGLLKADAAIDFYAYSREVWGVSGTVDVSILSLVEVESDFFVGAPGFMISNVVDVGFDAGFLKAEAGFETMLWWRKNVSWGAYASVWAEGEILWGLAGFSARLEGALISSPAVLYCAGTVRAEVLWTEVFDGSVWVSVDRDGIDAGEGRNERYDAMIADARRMGDAMETDMHELADSFDEARNALGDLSEEQRAHAGRTLLETATGSIAVGLGYGRELGFDGPDQLQWVYDNVLSTESVRRMQSRPAELARNLTGINRALTDLDARRQAVDRNLSARRRLLETPLPTLTDLAAYGSPVGEKQYATVVIGDRTITRQTGQAFDDAKARTMLRGFERQKEQLVEYQRRLNTLAEEYTRYLDGLDSILHSGRESMSGVIADYGRVFDQINEYYADATTYLGESRATALTATDALEGRRQRILDAVSTQGGALQIPTVQRITALRQDILRTLSPGWNAPPAPRNDQEWRDQCRQLGTETWYNVPHAGFESVVESTAAARRSLARRMGEGIGSFETQWAGFTASIDGVYERKATLHELLFDLYDQLSLSASRLPDFENIARGRADPRAAVPGGGRAGVNPRGAGAGAGRGVGGAAQAESPRQRYLDRRDRIGRALEAPQISSLSGTATSNVAALSTLDLSWAADHPVRVAEYSYRLTEPVQPILIEGGNPGLRYRSMGTRRSARLSFVDDAFPEGTYTVRLKARGSGGYAIERQGTVSVSYLGDGDNRPITGALNSEDNTPPTTPKVTDDGAFTSSSVQLHARWKASDVQSGIQEYQYAIGTIVRAPDPGILGRAADQVDVTAVKDWTACGAMEELNIRELALEHARGYLVSVKARNGAGLWSPIGSSDGITVDATPPAAPRLSYFRQGSRFERLGGGGGLPENSLLAAWTAPRDEESGIDCYRYTIGTSPGDSDIVSGRTEGTVISHESLPLERDRLYYMRVWAENNAGSSGEADTASVRASFVDETPPPAGPQFVSVTYGKGALRASWTLPEEDPESGTLRYEYRVSTVTGQRETIPIPWTSVGRNQELTREISLTSRANTRHTLSVRVVNCAGLSTKSSRVISR